MQSNTESNYCYHSIFIQENCTQRILCMAFSYTCTAPECTVNVYSARVNCARVQCQSVQYSAHVYFLVLGAFVCFNFILGAFLCPTT